MYDIENFCQITTEISCRNPASVYSSPVTYFKKMFGNLGFYSALSDFFIALIVFQERIVQSSGGSSHDLDYSCSPVSYY